MARTTPTTPPGRPSMAVIVNNRPAMLIAPAINRRTADGMVEVFPRKVLAPGVNHVPAEYVDELEDMEDRSGPGKVWAMWRSLGYVKLMRAEEAVNLSEGLQSPASIAERSPVAVEAMVATETNPDVLKAWYGTDRRKETRTAITARLKVLSGETSAPAGQ